MGQCRDLTSRPELNRAILISTHKNACYPGEKAKCCLTFSAAFCRAIERYLMSMLLCSIDRVSENAATCKHFSVWVRRANVTDTRFVCPVIVEELNYLFPHPISRIVCVRSLPLASVLPSGRECQCPVTGICVSLQA